MVGTDWTYEQREPRLANKTQNGSVFMVTLIQSLVNESIVVAMAIKD